METILVVGLLALLGVLKTLAGAYPRGRLHGYDWINNLVNLGRRSIIVRPAVIGIEDDPKDPWYILPYRPFVKAGDPSSELAAAPTHHTVYDN